MREAARLESGIPKIGIVWEQFCRGVMVGTATFDAAVRFFM